MDYGNFVTALGRGEPKHVYLLCGEEGYYIRKGKERLLSTLFPKDEEMQDALQRIDGSINVRDLVGMVETAPFFSSRNVILLQNTALFRKKKGNAGEEDKDPEDVKELLSLLAHMPEFSYLIFVTSSPPDKRRKLYKAIEKYGLVLESNPLRPWEINGWLQGKLQSIHKEMDREAHLYFAGAMSMMQNVPLEYLDKEFDKLVLFSPERRITRKDLVAVFAGLPEVSSFSLLDAISAKDVRKAISILRRELREGIYLPMLLGLLARHVRQLWQAKILMEKGYRGKALAKPLELNPIIAERLGKAAASFSVPILKKAMLDLSDADYFLKRGQDGGALLENIVIYLCQ